MTKREARVAAAAERKREEAEKYPPHVCGRAYDKVIKYQPVVVVTPKSTDQTLRPLRFPAKPGCYWISLKDFRLPRRIGVDLFYSTKEATVPGIARVRQYSGHWDKLLLEILGPAGDTKLKVAIDTESQIRPPLSFRIIVQ